MRRALVLVALLAAADARAEVEAWRVLGFLETGDQVVFERERTRPGCREVTLEVFDARSNERVLSLGLARRDASGARCIADSERAEATVRAHARLEEALGTLAPPRPLSREGEAWVGPGVRVELAAEVHRPPAACGESETARAYLRFRAVRDGHAEPAGRLVMIPARPDPAAPGCWVWPDARATAVALRADARRLAAVVAGLPVVVALR